MTSIKRHHIEHNCEPEPELDFVEVGKIVCAFEIQRRSGTTLALELAALPQLPNSVGFFHTPGSMFEVGKDFAREFIRNLRLETVPEGASNWTDDQLEEWAFGVWQRNPPGILLLDGNNADKRIVNAMRCGEISLKLVGYPVPAVIFSDDQVNDLIVRAREGGLPLNYAELLERACFYQRHATVRLLLALRGGKDVNTELPMAECHYMLRRPIDSLVLSSSVPADPQKVLDCARELVFYGTKPVFHSHDAGTVWDFFRYRKEKNQLLWDYMVALEAEKGCPSGEELPHKRCHEIQGF
ncbi:MAG: hypothetical protein ACYCOU_03480 [Sulfobacillus sp.]